MLVLAAVRRSGHVRAGTAAAHARGLDAHLRFLARAVHNKSRDSAPRDCHARLVGHVRELALPFRRGELLLQLFFALFVVVPIEEVVDGEHRSPLARNLKPPLNLRVRAVEKVLVVRPACDRTAGLLGHVVQLSRRGGEVARSRAVGQVGSALLHELCLVPEALAALGEQVVHSGGLSGQTSGRRNTENTRGAASSARSS
mmetsp:Transcript_6635/g.17281  ORF Transcript_6635/g.17281 Transcript_6635/m.17281 type:complete len:200 (-) Transcript_6635:22-621(-)